MGYPSAPRKDLACVVTPRKPVLGFDAKFHSGYVAHAELDADNATIVIRVRSKSNQESPVYFQQEFHVPVGSSHRTSFEGDFDLGEGSYQVDWLLRAQDDHVCSASWNVDAALAVKDKGMRMALPRGAIRKPEDEKFQPEPAIGRSEAKPLLNVRVLLNFAPGKPNAAALDPMDTVVLMSILRNISRNPEIGKFSVVVFNTQTEQVLFDQEHADSIDFPAMGNAVKRLRLGTVTQRQLANKNSETDFLADLVKANSAVDSPQDGLIFIGPKALIDSTVPQDELKKSAGAPAFPVFYMNYVPYPMAVPWRDAIGRVVKFFKGWEYTVSDPRDVARAIAETVTRIDQSKRLRAEVR